MVKPKSSGIGKSNVEPLKSNVTLLKSEVVKFNEEGSSQLKVPLVKEARGSCFDLEAFGLRS